MELRTTPRDIPSTQTTKSSYVESVVKAIQDARGSSDITVKLLLSIDRSTMTIEDAEETVKLVEAFSAQSEAVVVGLDLSGNPNVSLIILIKL